MTERQQSARVAIDTCNTTRVLQLLEQVVIEALQQQILELPMILDHCEQELGVPVQIQPSTIESWALQHGIEWNRES